MKEKTNRAITGVLLFLVFFLLASCQSKQMNLTNLEQNLETLEQYELLEIKFTLPEKNSDSNKLNHRPYAEFITPDNEKLKVFAFEYQGFSRGLVNNHEILTKINKQEWNIRYVPEEIGEYEYKIKVNEKTIYDNGKFQSEKSENKEFVRTADTNSFYFDSGEKFFPVGMNIAWHSERGTYDYDYYFQRLKDNNIDLVRIVMTPWSLGLEWSNQTSYGITSDYTGLETYSQENSWRLDHILQSAENNDIYIILTFDIYGELREESNDPREQLWEYNPYNKENNGFLDSPEEFFTNERAKTTYKRKLDYIISRWSHNTNILGWELWNEADITENYNKESFYEWNDEMYDYLKKIDEYQHFITTSFADVELAQGFWENHKYDYINIHLYSSNVSEEIISVIENLDKYEKPILISEFGLGQTSEPELKDISGSNLQNTIKKSIEQEIAGSAMPWWWDEYIDKYNLYQVLGKYSIENE